MKIHKLNIITRIISRCLPIIKDTVLFSSFYGEYSDNPKYISEKLHYLGHNYDIIWVIDDRINITHIPSYIRKISLYSSEYWKYLLRSSIVIDNYMGRNGYEKKLIFQKL